MSAQDKATGKAEKITINSDSGRLSDADIKRMIDEAEENAELDKKRQLGAEARNQLESYLYRLKATINESLKLVEEDKQAIMNIVKEAFEWLEENGSAASQEEYNNWREKVESIASPILGRTYSDQSAQSGEAEPSVEEV